MFDISADCPDLLKVNQYTREDKHPLVSMFLIECIGEIIPVPPKGPFDSLGPEWTLLPRKPLCRNTEMKTKKLS